MKTENKKQQIMEYVEAIANTCWIDLNRAKRKMEDLEGGTTDFTKVLKKLLDELQQVGELADAEAERAAHTTNPPTQNEN